MERIPTPGCSVSVHQGVGRVILYEGNTIEELRADFESGIESYIAGCLADGREPRKAFSGTLNIRISPDIHSRIAMLAQEAGTTINGYIKSALENQLKLTHLSH